MPWDGDALVERMEEALERQQAAADARAHRPPPSNASEAPRLSRCEFRGRES